MSIFKKMAAYTTAVAVLSVPLFASSADALPRKHYRHHGYHASKSYDSLRRVAGGALADRNGWRYRVGYGWDNSCFNIDYMLSRYACTAQGHQ
jgi:hypothetical protein